MGTRQHISPRLYIYIYLTKAAKINPFQIQTDFETLNNKVGAVIN